MKPCSVHLLHAGHPGMVRNNTIVVYRSVPSCCHVGSVCLHGPGCCTFAQLQTKCWPARCQRETFSDPAIAHMADVAKSTRHRSRRCHHQALQARPFKQCDGSSSRRLTWESPEWPRTHTSAGLHTHPPRGTPANVKPVAAAAHKIPQQGLSC